MKNYSDPTANAALGVIERELKSKQNYVKKLKALRKSGKLTVAMIIRARSRLVGFYSYLYDEIFTD